MKNDKGELICKETGKPFRWFLSEDTYNALTPEMRVFIQDDEKSSLWGSGLLLDVVKYPNQCKQLVEIADLIRAKISQGSGVLA